MPVVYAQPMAQSMAVPMAVAQPVAAMPVGQPVPWAPQAESFTAGLGYTPQQPAGRWRSNLCSWCDAGCGMCCAATCCAFITGPQLYEKVLGQKGACMRWFIPMLFFTVLVRIGDLVVRSSVPVNVVLVNSTSGEDTKELNTTYFVFLFVALGGGIGMTVLTTIVLSAVRKRIREKDQIDAPSCGGNEGCGNEDCCCSFWCGCCVTIQIFNQVNMRCETGYQLCSPEGVPTAAGPGV